MVVVVVVVDVVGGGGGGGGKGEEEQQNGDWNSCKPKKEKEMEETVDIQKESNLKIGEKW